MPDKSILADIGPIETGNAVVNMICGSIALTMLLSIHFTHYIIVVKQMKKSYASSQAVPIWFDDSTVKRLNEMALHMQRPRNSIIRRMLELMLNDIDAGRNLYPEDGISGIKNKN